MKDTLKNIIYCKYCTHFDGDRCRIYVDMKADDYCSKAIAKTQKDPRKWDDIYKEKMSENKKERSKPHD